MSDRQYHAGRAAGIEHGLGVGAAERQRLLAKDLLSRSRGGDHLRAVQRMRRCQQDRVDGGVGEDVAEAVGQSDAALAAKLQRPPQIGLNRARNLQARICRGGFDKAAAPTAKAGDGASDHEDAPEVGRLAPIIAFE